MLSAGSIDTPRLLMLSGVGDADELQALGIRPRVDLRGVGKNLQDHIIVAGLCFEPRTALPPPNNNLEGSTFFWRSRQSLASPDLMFVALQIPLVTPEIAEVHSVPQNGFCIAPGLMRIKSRGPSAAAVGSAVRSARDQPNMLSDPEDVEALAAAIELGFDIADQPAYRDLIGRWAAPPRHCRNRAGWNSCAARRCPTRIRSEPAPWGEGPRPSSIRNCASGGSNGFASSTPP